MDFENVDHSKNYKEFEESPTEEQVNNFLDQIRDIEHEIALINAVGDELDKSSKLNALEVIKKLKTITDLEQRKDLVSELEQRVALINATGDKLDKDSKLKALELISELK